MIPYPNRFAISPHNVAIEFYLYISICIKLKTILTSLLTNVWIGFLCVIHVRNNINQTNYCIPSVMTDQQYHWPWQRLRWRDWYGGRRWWRTQKSSLSPVRSEQVRLGRSLYAIAHVLIRGRSTALCFPTAATTPQLYSSWDDAQCSEHSSHSWRLRTSTVVNNFSESSRQFQKKLLRNNNTIQ